MTPRHHDFHDFCVLMLGSQPTTPIRVGEDQINGALLSALVEAYKVCSEPDRKPCEQCGKPLDSPGPKCRACWTAAKQEAPTDPLTPWRRPQ